MAKFKDGILGGFTGKVGTVVGVQKGNTYYMRSLPKKRTKFTEAEKINQAKFKLVQDYLQPIKALLSVGFKSYFTKTGGYRAAIAYTRKHALVTDDAGFYIDPALFRISGGELEPALNPTVAFSEGSLLIKWDQSTNHANGADQLLALVYDPKKMIGMSVIYQGAYRQDGQFELPIQLDFLNREVDVYIGFLAADRSEQSISQYLGRLKLS